MVRPIALNFNRDFCGGIRRAVVAAIVLIAAAAIGGASPRAFAAGMAEEDVPATSVVPDSTESAPAPPSLPPASKPKTKAAAHPSAEGATGVEETAPPAAPKHTTSSTSRTRTATSHHTSSHTSAAPQHVEVESANARLKLVQDTPAFSSPSKKSRHLEQLHIDKFVNVTGSTRYFLQVKLKNGEVAYVEPAAVSLIKTTDKIFQLTHNAAVLEKPNRWAKKVAEVHQPHNVHVIGIALDYMMIKMKSGLVGFIPVSALQ
ncbi:MAG: hypothetical protein Q7S58_00255 [Candidatus Binatus sp.]|uniref:hypothetical protein n=1 Tax=Candidatus Binatus sp. TaxID=2811406 RepID=UPI00271A75E5|nr:hypothetical protein [Candidatus Binatus sp.]MDO8430817.1 hypothetical protein [Candidatus Binatus sp.]